MVNFSRRYLPNLACLLCQQASRTPVCQWCSDEMQWLAPPGEGENLLLRPDIASAVAHSHFTALKAAAWYTWPFDSLIHALKFSHKFTLADYLSDAFLQQYPVNQAALPDLLLPVPMTYRRYWHRHYNQAVEICKKLAAKYQLRWESQWAQRIDNRTQHTLGREDRKQHAQQAYCLQSHLSRCDGGAPQRVAIIDDVVTTGQTANSLAAALKAQWPSLAVEVWTMGITPAPGQRR
ncbi:ComF family protein [Alteromonas sp. H39]|uniref:ComF family protein n=1 Tax=Alteromonas sp. H39 TaxID=3389876 RepID=UPI0039E05059